MGLASTLCNKLNLKEKKRTTLCKGIAKKVQMHVLRSRVRPARPPSPFLFFDRRALRGLCEMGDLISSIAWYACRVLFCSNYLTCAMQGQAGRLGAPSIKTTSECRRR